MKKIYVSVICYANESEVLSFAKEIGEQTISDRIVLIVVYNKITSEEKREQLESGLDALDIQHLTCDPHDNLGYLHGCLYGLGQLETEKDSWCVICNTDLHFGSADFFARLIAVTEDDNDIWGVAPAVILRSNGRPQNPFMVNRPSAASIKKLKLIFSNYLFYSLYIRLYNIKKRRSAVKTTDHPENIYAAHGCFMFLKHDLAEILTQNNDPIFMYEEEILVAEYIFRNKKTFRFVPEAVVYHLQGEIKADKRKQKWLKQSIGYLYDKFFK